MSSPFTLTVLTPCRNEVDNLRPLRDAVRSQLSSLPGLLDYDHPVIDNASTRGSS